MPYRKGSVRILTQALILGGKPGVTMTCEERPLEGGRDGVVHVSSILLPLHGIESPRNQALGFEIRAIHVETIPADLWRVAAGSLGQAKGATLEELLQDGTVPWQRAPQQRELASFDTCIVRMHVRCKRAREDIPDFSGNGRPRSHGRLGTGRQDKLRGRIPVDRRDHREGSDARLLRCIRGGGQEKPTPHLARQAMQTCVGTV